MIAAAIGGRHFVAELVNRGGLLLIHHARADVNKKPPPRASQRRLAGFQRARNIRDVAGGPELGDRSTLGRAIG